MSEPGPEPRLDLRRILAGATAVLREAGVPSPEHDARALAAHAFGLARLEPAIAPPVTPDVVAVLAALVERRRRREPLQHIVGTTGFRYLTLHVVPGVFVPRPETEVVAGVAIEEVLAVQGSGGIADRGPLVVDLCTGAGGIAAAVATETQARVIAVDASAQAVALAAANLRQAGVPSAQVLQGDVRDDTLLADLDGTVDVVVANPPYIPPDAVPHEPEVRDHDPDLALYGGGSDGLEIPAAVIAAAARLLRPRGLLVMEHAEVQGAGTRALAEAAQAFTEITTGPDLTGRDRFLRARRRTSLAP